MKLVITTYRLEEMSGGFCDTSYDQLWTWRNIWRVCLNWLRPLTDLEKCLEGLVKLVMTSNKLVMTSCRLGEMSGGFAETSYDQLQTWRNVWRAW